MTKRDFLNDVARGNVTEDVKTFALAELERLDSRNESRSGKQKEKTAKENAPYIAVIREYMQEHINVTAAEISEKLEISVQKASALLRGLVATEELTADDVRIAKKGKCKVYNLTSLARPTVVPNPHGGGVVPVK